MAAHTVGWNTVAWSEWNPFCQKVLAHHFPNSKGYGDIKKVDFTEYANKIDIVTGGFPCQPYSLAGKRKGKEDDRHLWPEMLRAIGEIRPRWVVGENVYGLVNWSGGLVFHEVQTDLEAKGYEVFPYVLPACATDAPHRRDRVWFIAHATGSATRPPGKSGEIKKNGSENNNQQGRRRFKTELDNGRCDVLQPATDTDNKLLQGGGNPYRPKETERHVGAPFCGTKWQNFPTQSPICSGNDGVSYGLDGITFSKWRTESIKAYGNAIVPQVAIEIFKTIILYESTQKL